MLYEFPKSYQYDTGDLSITGTGSGIHLFKDITLSFGITDRMGENLNTAKQINDNPYVGNMFISILDTGGNVVYPNFQTGKALKSFTFTEQQNINVFGSYQKDFGILIDLEDNTAGNYDVEYYLYGNTPEISEIKVKDGSGEWLYADVPQISWDVASFNTNNWSTGTYYAELKLQTSENYGGDNSGEQSGIATGEITIQAGGPSGLYWEAWIRCETENFGYDYASISIDGNIVAEVSGTEEGGDSNGRIYYFGGYTGLTTGTHTIELFYDTVDGEYHTSDYGIYFKASSFPYSGQQSSLQKQTVSGAPQTGSLEMTVKTFNDPNYSRIKYLEIYTDTGSNVEINDDNFYKRLPVFKQNREFNAKLDIQELSYNTEYYFKIVAYSEIGSGLAAEIGPHFIIPTPDIEVNIFAENLYLVNDSETGDMSLITGEIPSSSSGVIDYITTGSSHVREYITKITDSSGNIQSSKLIISMASIGSIDSDQVSLTEYAISNSGSATYELFYDSGNSVFELRVSTPATPATFKALRTSI